MRDCFDTAAPEFSTEQIHETLTLKEGETVIMELPYSASPAPRVTWDFNGRPLVSSRRVTVDVIRNMTSACIGHVEMADAGTYTVTLENPYGKSTCSIKVKVFGKYCKCCICFMSLSIIASLKNTQLQNIYAVAEQAVCRSVLGQSVEWVTF